MLGRPFWGKMKVHPTLSFCEFYKAQVEYFPRLVKNVVSPKHYTFVSQVYSVSGSGVVNWWGLGTAMVAVSILGSYFSG